MNSRLTPLDPLTAAQRLESGQAVLVDIREPDEFAGAHVKGARSCPLSTLQATSLRIEQGREVIFACKSGMRTGMHCERLIDRLGRDAFVLDGGLDAWVRAGLPVERGRQA